MPMVTIESVRELALSLPRSYEAIVRDRVKFRVGQLVYLDFSRDEQLMGFGFPKEERDAMLASRKVLVSASSAVVTSTMRSPRRLSGTETTA